MGEVRRSAMSSKRKNANMKILMAKARKRAREAEREEQVALRKEDQKWLAFKVPKSRAAQKRDEKAERRTEATARKAEARRLAEEEYKELQIKKPVQRKKVTEAERRCHEEGVRKAREESTFKMSRRTTTEVEYMKMVSVTNTNRLHDSVTGAIAGLTLNDHFEVVMKENPGFDIRKEKKKISIQKGRLQGKLWNSTYLADDDFEVF